MRIASASDEASDPNCDDLASTFRAYWLRDAIANGTFDITVSSSSAAYNADGDGFSLVGKAYQPTALVMMKRKVELKERLKPVKIALDRPTKSRRDLPVKHKKVAIIVKRKGDRRENG